MSTQKQDFLNQLLLGIIDSDPGTRNRAIEQVVTTYEKTILSEAKCVRDGLLRLVIDENDIRQSVCVRLVERLSPDHQSGPIVVNTENDLIALLRTITRNLVSEKQRHYIGTARRDLRRQQSLEVNSTPDRSGIVANVGYEDDRRSTRSDQDRPSHTVRKQEAEDAAAQLVMEARGQLGADDWYICRRFYLDGDTQAAIGAAMDPELSAGAVGMRLRRIRDRLLALPGFRERYERMLQD